jgi:hypothetical protein
VYLCRYILTVPGVGSYDTSKTNSYTIYGLANNTTYSWSVEAYFGYPPYPPGCRAAFAGSACGVTGQPYGSFTTGSCCVAGCGDCSVSCGGGTQTCTRADCSTYSRSCNPQACKPQCSDTIDNDGDGKIDSADPGCHSDGNPLNPVTYNPNLNDESFNPADFSLNSSNTIYATLVEGQPGQSTATTLTITPFSGFQNPIDLSVQSVSPSLPVGSTYYFSDSHLSNPEYSAGSQFKVNIGAGLSASQTYTITIKAVDGGLVRTTNVLLNAQVQNPDWREI